MAIFYTDTGSINRLEVSGSTILSGSLIVSGTTNFGPGGLTASLFGTSSWAQEVVTITNAQVNEAIQGGSLNAFDLTIDNALVINSLSDTTSANKVLVINTSTNQVFTTASVGGGGGGTGMGFPYDGTVTPAIISGSLIISSSHSNAVTVSGSVNNFFEVEVINFSAGNNASSDFVASANNSTDNGNYIDMGINSTTYNGGLVGGPSDGYIYLTSSVGELHVGNASPISTGNVRLFAGGPSSDNTTKVFISASGNVGIGTTTNLRNTLSVNGSISASAGITGSFTGSFSGSLDRFNPAALRITVGTTAPSSPAVNDLWVDTN